MCLTNASEIKTAEKNILVYKELNRGVQSPFYDYIYKKGLQKNEVSIVVKTNKKVYEGYHSYNNEKSVYPQRNLNICIIPKGVKYVDGFDNDDFSVKNRASENLYYVGKWTLMNFLKAKFLCTFNVNLNKHK